jgi:acyl-CoA dehydrogenase
MSDPSFNPRALMDDEPVEFTKSMEVVGTIPGPELVTPQVAPIG